MNRFDKRFNKVIREASLMDIAGGVATGVGAGLRAAQNPSSGVKDIIGGFKQLGQNREELLKQSFSLKNPPKLNQIVVTTAPVLGAVIDPKTAEEKTLTVIPNATIVGKITKVMDKTGNYGVALTDEKGKPSQKYVFSKTDYAPYWQVYDVTKLPRQKTVTSNEQSPFDQPQVGEDEQETTLLPAIMTGPAKEDVSEPLKAWRDYNFYLKSQKK